MCLTQKCRLISVPYNSGPAFHKISCQPCLTVLNINGCQRTAKLKFKTLHMTMINMQIEDVSGHNRKSAILQIFGHKKGMTHTCSMACCAPIPQPIRKRGIGSSLGMLWCYCKTSNFNMGEFFFIYRVNTSNSDCVPSIELRRTLYLTRLFAVDNSLNKWYEILVMGFIRQLIPHNNQLNSIVYL